MGAKTMNNILEEKKSFIILLAVILFLLVGLFYVYKVMPVKDEIANLERTVSSTQADIALLESALNKTDEGAEESLDEYLDKLPLSPAEDEIVRELARVESASNSSISSITFNTGDIALTEQDFNNLQFEETEGVEDAENAGTNNTTTDYTGIANQLKSTQVQLSVTSPNYDAFLQFLKGIEDLERITRIENLSFSNPTEEEGASPISFSLQLSAFYYAGK